MKWDLFATSLKILEKYNLIDNQIIRCIKLESLLVKRKKFIQNDFFIDEI